MKVVAVVPDLLLFSRLDGAARAAGADVVRVDSPMAIPDDADLVLVDWSAREADWAGRLRKVDGTRLVLFGPHTDLEAHADARRAGLGPMWARSKLVGNIQDLVRSGASTAHSGTP